MKVSSRAILYALGIKNIKTLTRWYQAGLIPEPTIERQEEGSGTMAFWPKWVLDHCRVIKQMTDSGHTMADIAGAFGQDWEALAASYRRYRFARVTANMDRDQLLMEITGKVRNALAAQLAGIRGRLEVSQYPPVTQEIIMQGLLLIENGFNPVLVVSPSISVAVPDFLVSQKLSQSQLGDELLLVLPICAMLKRLASKPRSIKMPTMKPVDRIRCESDSCEHQVVVSEEDWSFEIPSVPDITH